MSLESIKYNNGSLEILDQLLLPVQSKYVTVKGVEDGWKVINKMQVCKKLKKKKISTKKISESLRTHYLCFQIIIWNAV